jgi:hypothetical protein
MTKFYKNSNGAFVFGNKAEEIYPAGVCRLLLQVKNNVQHVRIYNVISKEVLYDGILSDLRKSDGSTYTDAADLISGVWDFFTKQSANSGFQRHDDMQGIMSTVTGGSSLNTLAIRDTGCTMLSFANNQNDIAVQVYQFSHKKKLGSPLDSLHLHYFLPVKPEAGQTVKFLYNYTWYNAHDVIPAIADWETDTVTYTFTGEESQFSTGVISIIENIPAPENESYSSFLRVKVTRIKTGEGADTYTGELGIDYFDVHYLVTQQGSIFEFSDTE